VRPRPHWPLWLRVLRVQQVPWGLALALPAWAAVPPPQWVPQ
jgi:hypothetical protein